MRASSAGQILLKRRRISGEKHCALVSSATKPIWYKSLHSSCSNFCISRPATQPPPLITVHHPLLLLLPILLLLLLVLLLLWYQFIVLSCFSPSQWETLPPLPIFLLIGLFLFSRRVLLFHLPPHYKQHLYNDTAATNNGLGKSLKIQRNKTCCQHLKYKRNTKHMLTRASFMIGLKAVILSLQVGLFIHSCFWVISGECSFSSFPFLPIFLFLCSPSTPRLPPLCQRQVPPTQSEGRPGTTSTFTLNQATSILDSTSYLG